MKRIRSAVACVLAMMLLGAGAMAEEPKDVAGEEIGVFGAIGETPEQVIVSAMEIFSWFTISPLDVDPELPGGEGSDTWRVADETLCNHEMMMALLNDTFSAEIVTEMLAYEIYSVIDGSLYTTAGGRAIDPNIAWVEYEETFSDENMIVYTATVHYYGEGMDGIVPDVFEFIRERVEEKWLFTQFPFFW